LVQVIQAPPPTAGARGPRSYREAAAACAVLPAVAAAAPLALSAFCRPLPEDAATTAAAQSCGLQARPRCRLPCMSRALHPGPRTRWPSRRLERARADAPAAAPGGL